jgi:hypothetical protein
MLRDDRAGFGAAEILRGFGNCARLKRTIGLGDSAAFDLLLPQLPAKLVLLPDIGDVLDAKTAANAGERKNYGQPL